MRFTTLGLSLMAATSALAAPTVLSRRATGGQNVVYWGQNGGGTIENNDLSTYCSSTAGIDILVLAFLYEYGNGNTVASGTIGQSCSIAQGGVASNCDSLASAITTCQSKGIKIILSLGGAAGAYSLSSQAEAETIGQNLWDAYGKGGKGSAPRPFGDVFVNGWDFDIESNSGNQYYQYMIAKLRSNFAKDSSNTYYITGAPQCPLPEPNMGEIISASQFDYLWIQFYNNPGCSTNGNINYADWKSTLASGPSKDAKIFIGVPAAPDGATGTASGAQYYLTPAALASLVAKFSSDSSFGGVMTWSAGFSDSNMIDGQTYAQHVKGILGSPAAAAPPSPVSSAGPAPTSTEPATKPQPTTVAPTYAAPSPTAPTTTSAPAVPNKGPNHSTPAAAEPTTLVPVASPSSSPPASEPTSTPSVPSTGSSPVSGQQSGPCSPEGYWACVSGTGFQRCAGGQWSVLMALPAGVKCTGGVAATIEMVAA